MIFIHCHPETHLSVLSYESAFLLHCHQVYCTRITPVFTMRYNKEYLRLKTETNLAFSLMLFKTRRAKICRGNKHSSVDCGFFFVFPSHCDHLRVAP